MLLRELQVENFGVFDGVHSFDLSPPAGSSERNVILIGGQNGAGKTTFLEAVRLCLYGRLAVGPRVSERHYLDHLRSRIHRPASPGSVRPGRARLTLVFDYAVDGERKRYEVTRSWISATGTTSAVKESLTVLCQGEVIEGVAEEHWGDIIEELIPFGVSQLFFFDGEKIKDLADDSTGMEHLATAMKSMLGLDLIERLRADLAIYRSRRLKDAARGKLAEQLQEAEDTVATAVARCGALRTEKLGLEAGLDMARSRLRLAEADLRRSGGRFALARDATIAQIATIEERLANIESEARRLTEGVLPFAFCAPLAQRTLQQLDKETKQRQSAVLVEHLNALALELSSELGQDATGQEGDVVVSRAVDVVRAYAARHDSAVPLVHDLGDSAASQFRAWIEFADGNTRVRAQELAQALASAERQLRELQKQAQLAPGDDALSKVVDQLATVRSEVHRIEQDLERNADLLAAAEREHTARERDAERVRAKLALQDRLDSSIALSEKSIAAMEAYQQRLTEIQVRNLQANIARRFQQLARKDDLLETVRVDPDTFEVTLVGRDGRQLSRRELSAGEKQIYAIATLWGLADTSRRPLPMVVDTPLGRLDSAHRQNLIHGYFPKVAHQVIVLSTDTEVDEQLFQDLEPYVGRAYLLEARDGRTVVSDGYFWRGEAA